MNKEILLWWILQDAQENSHHYRLEANWEDKLDDILMEDLRSLAKGHVELPQSIPSTPAKRCPFCGATSKTTSP